ncbi:MAG: DNA repair protein RecO [Xanthobacteraceae bacterium]
MQWSDDGIVLGIRRHGEASAILEVMTHHHGRHLGLVRGGTGSRLRPVLQPGNSVGTVWRARLEEHLGNFAVEGTRLRAAEVLASAYGAYAVTHLAALCRLLPERDPHADVYDALGAILDHLGDSDLVAVRIVHFELMLLGELGFALDLGSCAATGGQDDLIYVSPKSGRAVSREAGEQWKDKLLRLPDFLKTPDATEPPAGDVADGFALTGYFLACRVLEPRGLQFCETREAFIARTLHRGRGTRAAS